MLERDIERKVTLYARKKNFLTYKFVSPSNRSVPDRLFISPSGAIFFVEFKQSGKCLSKLQNITFQKFNIRKIPIKVVDNYEKGKTIIDAYITEPIPVSK